MTNPSDFPLLNECVAQGDAWALFPLLKDWSREKLNELLEEINHADEGTTEAWGKLAVQAENFLNKRRSEALDKAKMETFCMLSEISSVALYYIGRFEERCKSAGAVPPAKEK